MPTYASTQRGYANLWGKADLASTKRDDALSVARKIITLRDRYEPVAETIGYPNVWPLIGALHTREADNSFAGVLHNGERIIGTGRRTSLVPSGRGPFSTWEEAAVDALRLKGWQSIDEWPIARWLYEAERYNGFGYFSRGINSPYVWAATTLQQRGKYVADGKFSSSTWDQQLGVAAILKAIFELEASLEPGAGEPEPPAVIDRSELISDLVSAIAPILEKYVMAGAAVDQTKSWAQSKTIWGALIAAAPTLLVSLGPAFGLTIPEDAATQIVQTAVTVGGAIFAIYGRLAATKQIG